MTRRSARRTAPPSDRLRTPIREARLRRSYAALYPDLKPGEWVPASVLAEFVLERGLYQRRTGPAAKERLLDGTPAWAPG